MRPSRTVSTLVILGLAAGVVYKAYKTFWGADGLSLSGTSLLELAGRDTFWEFILFSIGMIGMIIFEVMDLRNAPPADIPDGLTAKARVIRMWDTGVSVNEDPQVELLLDITPPNGGPAFQAKAKIFLSRLETALVRSGTTAEVKYDPKKPQRVKILSLEIRDAAAGGIAARLEELAELRDKGEIDEEEFDRRRKAILEQL
jgi:hypothetical protein